MGQDKGSTPFRSTKRVSGILLMGRSWFRLGHNYYILGSARSKVVIVKEDKTINAANDAYFGEVRLAA